MALSLIDLLNKHRDKTPDEILTQLQKRGWIYLADISAWDHEYLFNRNCVLIMYFANRGQRPWHIVHGPSGQWNFWFDREYCHSNWQGAWACRVEEYENGSFPDRAPGQVRG